MQNQCYFLFGLIFCAQVNAANEYVSAGRYTLVKPEATQAQQDPLSAVIESTIPASVKTVGGAVQVLLVPTGYRLAAPDSDGASILLSRPLPEVHRSIGPITVRSALQALAGTAYNVAYEPVTRMVSFVVKQEFREAASKAAEYASTNAVTIPLDADGVSYSPEKTSSITSPAPSASLLIHDTASDAGGDDMYGPVKAKETLSQIAMHYHNMSKQTTFQQIMVSIFQANLHAFGNVGGSPNMNYLRINAMLTMPSADAFSQVPPGTALSVVNEQYAAWRAVSFAPSTGHVSATVSDGAAVSKNTDNGVRIVTPDEVDHIVNAQDANVVNVQTSDEILNQIESITRNQ